MESFTIKRSSKYNSILVSFIFSFFAISIVVVGSLLLYYKTKSDDHLQYLKITEQQTLRLEKSVIVQKFDSLRADLFSLAKQDSLLSFCKAKTSDSTKLVKKEFADFCRAKGFYDQIRFIDKRGIELFRVDQDRASAESTVYGKRKSKKACPIFRDIYRLGSKQIYMSPLQFVGENGRRLSSGKAVITLGTPVFNQFGEKIGVIIVDYLASDIISTIKNYAKLALGRTMLIDSDGRWLLGAKDSAKELNFIDGGDPHKKFSEEYPTVWEKIVEGASLQMITREGMFTSTTIPLSQIFKDPKPSPNAGTSIIVRNRLFDSTDYFWKLITFIPRKEFVSDVNKILLHYLLRLARLLIILSTIPAFLIAYTITKRRYYRLELYKVANFDKLTKLPNRKHFFEALEHTVRQAIKAKSIFALLYLDIDNFKTVNDTLGHEQGDNLLQAAATRFVNSVRKTDLVARLGGDEFVIILYNIQSVANAKTVAAKILDSFSEPFLLNEEEVKVGISIGISVFSKASNNDSILVRQADDAMYKAKHSGKNRFKVFMEKKDNK